jgi:hypothetical protein
MVSGWWRPWSSAFACNRPSSVTRLAGAVLAEQQDDTTELPELEPAA